MPGPKRKLTPFERYFVDLYLTTCMGNASQAARIARQRCDPNAPALSMSAYGDLGYKTLHRTRVARVIGHNIARRTPTNGEIVGELARVGFMPIDEKTIASKVKALEVLTKVKRLGENPLEAMLARQLRALVMPMLPANVVALLPEGGGESERAGDIGGRPEVHDITALQSAPLTREAPKVRPGRRRVLHEDAASGASAAPIPAPDSVLPPPIPRPRR